MDIGKPKRTWIVEPAETPSTPAPERVPEREPKPEPQPEKVPAK